MLKKMNISLKLERKRQRLKHTIVGLGLVVKLNESNTFVRSVIFVFKNSAFDDISKLRHKYKFRVAEVRQ